MFEVGFSELLVIFVLALIVLGPEKLPRLAAQVGRWIGRARAMAKQFREQLEEEVNVAEASKWKSTTPSPEPAPPPPAEPAPSAEPVTTSGAQPDTAHASYESTHEGASDGSHDSGPPPEPEAAVYEPPAYSSAPASNGAHGASAEPSHPPAASSDEAPLRPGDVVTTTHERGN
jgi:sec-independent protein translocase protein TatB